MTTQEQIFGVLIIVGVIFSILTNVALYYYGEHRTLRKKYESGEDLHVKIDDFVERHNQNVINERLCKLEDRMDSLASIEFDNRVKTDNDIFLMKQDGDLIKFIKGVNKENITHNFEEIKKNLIELKTRVTMLESDEEVVKKEFLYGKLREIDRRVYDIKDMVNGGKGVNDGSKK
jgi:hypothetical protein